MKKISIIIPVYNVESYLPKCLDSLYAQYERDTMEVILVNDGSTDNSLSVCREYKERYPDTILIDKPNGGLSDARNVGTEMAGGEYIYYLDSDDWIAPNALMQLFRFAVEYQCEVVQGGFYYAYDDHLLFDCSSDKLQSPILLTKEEGMKALIENQTVKNFAWGKLYKAEIVKEHPFRKGVYFEDSFWQHLIMDEVTQYGIISTPLYYYRQRDDGISGSFSLRNMDLLKGYEERIAFVKTYYPPLLYPLLRVYWETMYSFYTLSKSHKEPMVRKNYQDYWEYANHVYHQDFQKALKESLIYKLVQSRSAYLPFYLLLKRVWNHFHASSFSRIEIK